MKVKPFIYTKNKLNLNRINRNKCKDRKQKVALMPNLVHSLDTASLCIVRINYFNQENIVGAPTPVNSNTNSSKNTESQGSHEGSYSGQGARAKTSRKII